MDSRLQLQLVALALLSLACGVGYKPAVTADQVAESRRFDKVLVEYLAQTSADPVVCDVQRRDGPSLPMASPRVVRTLTLAMERGELSPFRWSACTRLLFERAPPVQREGLRRQLERHVHLQPVSSLLAELQAPKSPGGEPIPEGVVIRGAAWEPGPEDTVLLRVAQDPAHGVVRLLPAARDGSRSPDASVDLHGGLEITIVGSQTPLSLCPGQAGQPCYPPERLHMVHEVAALAPTGRVRFPETLQLDEVLRLGQEGDHLQAQLLVDGAVAKLDLPIRWDSVPGWTYMIGTYGTQPIQVQAWELSHQRLLIEFRGGLKERRQVVSFDDAAFGIRGQVSEPGEPSDIHVRLRCTHCTEARRAIERMMSTERGELRVQEVED